MKIAVDLRPLQIGHEYRGIGTYLVNILSRIPKGAQTHYIFYQFDTSEPLDNFGINKPDSCEIIRIPRPVWRRSVWDLIRYVKSGLYPNFPKLSDSQPEVFLQPDFQLGLPKIRGCKNFVVMYDLIPLIMRNQYMPSWREPLFDKSLRWYSRIIVASKNWFHQKRYLKNLKSVSHAYKILSISKSTTDDLFKYLSIEKSKVKTIYLAPSFRFGKRKVKVGSIVSDAISKINRPFVTYIGGTDARRSIEELIFAFDHINGQGMEIDLVLAGNEFRKVTQIPNVDARNAILASSFKKQIHLLGYLTEVEKEYLLKRSSVFVYPTQYEGFGLPILEAMHVGCPVVTFNNSSIPEVGGDAVLYAEPPDMKGISQAVIKILRDPELSRSLSAKGKSQIKKFDWDTTASQTWQEILAA